MEPALISAVSRPLVRALSALIRRKDADAHSETAFVRGLRDTRVWVKDKPLGLTVLCGLPASLVAVLATVLTDESPLWLQLAAAGAGFVVGTLLAVAALLVTQWLAAPVRQRDEARAQLAPASSDELASLVQDLDSFVIAERATRPASPVSLFIETAGMDREDSARLMAERKNEVDAARRRSLRRYHDELRPRVLTEFARPGRDPLSEAHGKTVRDPKHLEHIARIHRVLAPFADPRADVSIGTVQERARLAHELRELAVRIDSAADDRARETHQRYIQERARAAEEGAARSVDVRGRLETAQRQARAEAVRAYATLRDELLDRAQSFGALMVAEHRQLCAPDIDAAELVPRLRRIATDLDGADA